MILVCHVEVLFVLTCLDPQHFGYFLFNFLSPAFGFTLLHFPWNLLTSYNLPHNIQTLPLTCTGQSQQCVPTRSARSRSQSAPMSSRRTSAWWWNTARCRAVLCCCSKHKERSFKWICIHSLILIINMSTQRTHHGLQPSFWCQNRWFYVKYSCQYTCFPI